jgi:hypothetical protein
MDDIGSGEGEEREMAKPVKQSTAAQSPDLPKATRKGSKRTAATKAEALEILTSALEIVRQAGIEVRGGQMPSENMVGISLYPARFIAEQGQPARIEEVVE